MQCCLDDGSCVAICAVSNGGTQVCAAIQCDDVAVLFNVMMLLLLLLVVVAEAPVCGHTILGVSMEVTVATGTFLARRAAFASMVHPLVAAAVCAKRTFTRASTFAAACAASVTAIATAAAHRAARVCAPMVHLLVAAAVVSAQGHAGCPG